MTKIYLLKNSNNNHHDAVIPKTTEVGLEDNVAIAKENAPTISVYVDVQPAYFEIKMSYDETTVISGVTDQETGITSPNVTLTEKKYLVWQKLPISVLQNITGFNDQTGWSVDDRTVKLDFSNDSPTARILGDYDLVDIFSTTLISKPSSLSTRQSPHYQSSWSLFVPFVKDAVMTDFVYRLKFDIGLNYVIDPSSPSKLDIIDGEPAFKDLIAPITVTNPQTLTADSVAQVNVSTLPGIDSLYIEPIVGQVNKTKVTLNNGVGSFNIITAGLSAGEIVEVKLGYKKWSNVIKYTQTIA